MISHRDLCQMLQQHLQIGILSGASGKGSFKAS